MKVFDLEERSLVFAKSVIDLTEKLPKSDKNRIHTNQILRSSSSIGANYIEANEGLGTKDFYLRLKIARNWFLEYLDLGS
jgi:four helix bundle protein